MVHENINEFWFRCKEITHKRVLTQNFVCWIISGTLGICDTHCNFFVSFYNTTKEKKTHCSSFFPSSSRCLPWGPCSGTVINGLQGQMDTPRMLNYRDELSCHRKRASWAIGGPTTACPWRAHVGSLLGLRWALIERCRWWGGLRGWPLIRLDVIRLTLNRTNSLRLSLQRDEGFGRHVLRVVVMLPMLTEDLRTVPLPGNKI